ncbi:MAG: hypothetical protein ABIX01_23815 [Chitinophagaceae bacterium]
MKKTLLGLAFLGVFCTANAAGANTLPATVAEMEYKKFDETCSTQSASATDGCWSITVSATHCCECDAVTAKIGARVDAQYTLNDNLWIISYLSYYFPC